MVIILNDSEGADKTADVSQLIEQFPRAHGYDNVVINYVSGTPEQLADLTNLLRASGQEVRVYRRPFDPALQAEFSGDPADTGNVSAAPAPTPAAATSTQAPTPTPTPTPTPAPTPMFPSAPQRLTQQLEFIVEIDKIKGIIRQSKLFDGSRFENDAEHSWSICIMAILLKEYANFPVDLEKVIKMLLIHDIVEIDAGDVFLYDAARMDVNLKEEAAAQRIFGLLSPDQRDEYIALWREFESRTTPEAKFAAVFDRLEPLLQNYLNNGYTWKKYGIACETVVEKNRHIREGSEALWDLVQHILQHSVELGYFVPD